MPEFKIASCTGNEDSLLNCVFCHMESMYVCIVFNGINYICRNRPNGASDNTIRMNASKRKELNVTLSDRIFVKQCYFSEFHYVKEVLNFSIDPLQSNNKIKLNVEDIEDKVKSVLENLPLYTNVSYHIKINSKLYMITLLNEMEYGLIDRMNAQLNFLSGSSILMSANGPPKIFRADFSMTKLNIGGLSEELGIIFQRAFSTRLVSDKVCKQLGIRHIKGIMLHGAPGCGKTLIAQELGKMVGCNEPKIVAGPELISSYQGKSEENVRNLFTDAFNKPDELFVIICDECDAIFKKRFDLNSGTANNITNQFLSMIDGPKSLNNIILICMTNRLDLIDNALIRPGRIELILEIKLPDIKARSEIFNVHINKIDTKFRSDIDIDKLASLTDNYTGAEIASVILNGKSKAISRVIDIENCKDIDYDQIMLSENDIIGAINETIVMHGNKNKVFELVNDYNYDEEIFQSLLNDIILIDNTVFAAILFGNNYHTMAYACKIAQNIEPSQIVHINSEQLLTRSLEEILSIVFRSKTSVVILDCIENILKYNPLVNNCDNNILQMIYILLNKILEKDNVIHVILTSNNNTLCNNVFPNIHTFVIGEHI
jgi:Cdc6-like AAA superfamily ATPase